MIHSASRSGATSILESDVAKDCALDILLYLSK